MVNRKSSRWNSSGIRNYHLRATRFPVPHGAHVFSAVLFLSPSFCSSHFLGTSFSVFLGGFSLPKVGAVGFNLHVEGVTNANDKRTHRMVTI